jgi:hypothetical protein
VGVGGEGGEGGEGGLLEWERAEAAAFWGGPRPDPASYHPLWGEVAALWGGLSPDRPAAAQGFDGAAPLTAAMLAGGGLPPLVGGTPLLVGLLATAGCLLAALVSRGRRSGRRRGEPDHRRRQC